MQDQQANVIFSFGSTGSTLAPLACLKALAASVSMLRPREAAGRRLLVTAAKIMHEGLSSLEGCRVQPRLRHSSRDRESQQRPFVRPLLLACSAYYRYYHLLAREQPPVQLRC